MSHQHGKQIKNDRVYEALINQGNSKEKSALIANAQANPEMHPAKKGGKAQPYENWNKAELYKRAQTLTINGRSNMNKEELIEALRAH
ncbi:Rho termination factor [Psychromonas sp. SR45-3]|uniref:DUF7218 family protein n=1 Tax=Psychromonas sp. SR45-3 TaxID=2760930 RepID=UPI0015FAC6BD|nr:Rho termination factor [Psychromonas sp. SR45-3]MBB1274414.1 Rho termination factor [Psychromonas sp. SR45-3]